MGLHIADLYVFLHPDHRQQDRFFFAGGDRGGGRGSATLPPSLCRDFTTFGKLDLHLCIVLGFIFGPSVLEASYV